MPPWPPHLYRQAGVQEGRPPEAIERALAQSLPPQESWGCLPILTLNHLAFESQVPYRELRSVVARSHPRPYRLFWVTKRSGGQRLICVPLPGLCRAQRWIARNVLARVPPHAASFAYSPQRSALDCARMHCGCKWLVKVDAMQFFESISERQVYRVFRTLGYEPLVAFEMARICTRVTLTGRRVTRRRWHNSFAGGRYSITDYRSVRVGNLPQGAPTSPMLSNLVVWGLDDALAQFAAANDLVYTRYADDLLFSSASAVFTQAAAETVIRSVYAALRQHRLRPRTTKTLVLPPGARKVVLGLLVDTDRPRLPREFRERLEVHLFHLEKHGLVGHLERRGFASYGGMKAHIWGLLTYARHVDSEFAEPLMKRFNQLVWPT
jgi:RNA-directed DNA polymerase